MLCVMNTSSGSDKSTRDVQTASATRTDVTAAWRQHAEQLPLQQWPTGALYVVATPIGNLADMNLRAIYALQLADVVAAEDTRTSRTLLQAWGIETTLLPAHRHNEATAAQAIITRLAQGQRVALVSDAGTPAISDPGARIVHAVRAAGYRVIPIPGPSAVIAALMASGMTSDENPAFLFAGFPPPKKHARQQWLQQWCRLPVPVVMYESPHRLETTLRDLLAECGPGRQVTLARELTKRFEEITTLPMSEAGGWLREHAHRSQGEFVLIVEGAPAASGALDARADELLQALLETLSVKDATRLAARLTGTPRDVLYQRALELRGQAEEP